MSPSPAAVGVLAVILLSGCTQQPSMSRAEVISAVLECETAGMDNRILEREWNRRIVEVQCVPKKEPTP